MNPESVIFVDGLTSWPESESLGSCCVKILFSTCVAGRLCWQEVSAVQGGISDKLNGDHWVIPVSPVFMGVDEGRLPGSWSGVLCSLDAELFVVEMSVELQPSSFTGTICFLLILSVFTFLSAELLLVKNIERTFSAPSRTAATALRISPSSIASGSFCLQPPSLWFSELWGESWDSFRFWPASGETRPVDYRSEISIILHL